MRAARIGRGSGLWLAVGAWAAAAFGAGELLSNAGFEGGTAQDGIPEGGWYRSYGDANSKRVVQSGGAHAGERCLRLEAPTIPQKDPAVTIEQRQAVTPGTSYVLRAWAKGQPTGVHGLLVIVWLAKDHGWITTAGSEFALTDAWALHRVIALAPPGAVYGVARFDIRQPGTAWLDDVSFRLHQTDRIVADVRDGEISAGQAYQIRLTTLDSDGLPVPGAAIARAVATAGDGHAARATVAADERGEAVLRVRASSRPGLTDTLTVTAGAASLRIRARTAGQGQPTRWAVTAPQRVVLPGREIPITLQLLGAFGEPVPLAGREAAVAVTGSGTVTPASIATDRNGRTTVRLRAGTELFARATVTVRDADGVVGQSEPLIVAPPARADGMRLGKNRYFAHADGSPYLPLGGLYANFVYKVENGVEGTGVSPSIADVTDDQLRAWFGYLRDNGVTALRAMLRDHTKQGAEPMDAIGKVNLGLLRRWEHYMQVARPFRIRFLVTLHESWYATYASYHNRDCLEKCVLPCYTAAELESLPPHRRRFLVEKRMLEQTTGALSDPDVLACQRDYLTDLIPRLRANPDIFAYEIENEQPSGFFRWTSDQIALVRELDPDTPICISHLGSGMIYADMLPWSRRTKIDFYTYHIYPGGDVTSRELDYGTAVALTARYGRLGKPAFSGEAFGDEWFKATPAARSLGARDCIWSELLGGAAGCFFWATVDEPIKEFRLAHAIAGQLDLTRLRRAKPRVGIGVAHPLDDDGYFQTPAGRALYAALGRTVRECFRRGVDFDLTFEPGSYAVPVTAGDTATVQRLEPGVRVPAGYEAQYLRSADGRAFVAYLRNVAGTVPIQADPAAGWTRSRAATHLAFTLRFPFAGGRVRVIDLDNGAASDKPVARGRALDLGNTDHDFIVTGGW